MNNYVKRIPYACAYILLTMFVLAGCQDKVDESVMYSFKGQLMTDYFNDNDDFSDFAYLIKRVHLSDVSSSTVADLLSARGNYTCFAPDNNAVQNYIDSIYETKGYHLEEIPDSLAEKIVNNCIIDNGNEDAILSTRFVTGTIEKQSFAGRYITVRFDTLRGGSAAIYIDTYSLITKSDIEVENGVIHRVDRVLSPVTSTLPSLIEVTNNTKIFSQLLKSTGWSEKMLKYRDMYYEKNHPLTGKGCPTEPEKIVPTPTHRDFGYTAFIEPDSLLCKEWGIQLNVSPNGTITNWDAILPIISQKCKEYYPNATSEDLQSEDNAINQFISYHLIDESIPYNNLVVHYNEQGYGYGNPTVLGINSWSYYTTMGKQRRLLKITEGKSTEGKRINRYVKEYNLKNYSEINVPRPGIKIQETNGGREYSAINGYYYAINQILVYDDDVPNKVMNERMRYDSSDMFAEQMSSGFRRRSTRVGLHIPSGFFEGMTYSEDESSVVYLSGWQIGWSDYQGDEYNITGQYDVTFRLPPVPYKGTYELRFGCQNLSQRGMCQVYFGTNKINLPAYGLPMDMRIYGSNPSIGWVADEKDEDENLSNDKIIRLHGYMKAPLYFGTGNATMTTDNFRGQERVLRKIIWKGLMDPSKVYYVRLKSVLENTASQLFFDYIELVPKSVYDGVVVEDMW